MATILVLHDNLAKSETLIEMLEVFRHKVIELESAGDLMAHFSNGGIDIVLINQQGESSLALDSLNEISKEGRLVLTPVIVITAKAKSDDVIEAMRLGAFDHLSIPITAEELRSVIERALARPKQDLNPQYMKSQDDFLVGMSPAMKRVEKLIGISAGCDANVLICGETGTGKNTIVRTIHRHSQHKQEPLTIIDCTAVPEDYESFQSLSPDARGTVLLDEIGDLNPHMQAMLVRALKEAPSNSAELRRIIATTQHDLIAMVKEKRFREDLYYRLNVLPILLPPLRERGSDILSLAESFLQQARPAAPKQLSKSAAKRFLDYNWPGNVRELQNLMYHLTVVVRAMVIEAEDLNMITSTKVGAVDDTGLESMDYYDAMSALEKRLLSRALEKANGSRAEAARLLGVNRQLLYAKLKAHGLMKS